MNKDIDNITLLHMGIEIDLNRLLTEDYPNAHIDFAILLIQKNYFRYIKEIEKVSNGSSIPQYLKERAFLYSKLSATNWLVRHSKELMERSTAFLLEEAERTGWYRTDYFGYDTLLDFLASLSDAQEEGTSNAYYWNAFVTKVVPAAEKADIAPGQLLASSAQARKMHWLVTVYNNIERYMKTGAMTADQGEKEFVKFVEMAASSKVTSLEFEDNVEKWRGRKTKTPEPIVGYNCILGQDGKGLIIIETGNGVDSSMVTNSLRNKVVLETVGVKKIIKLLTELLNIKFVEV